MGAIQQGVQFGTGLRNQYDQRQLQQQQLGQQQAQNQFIQSGGLTQENALQESAKLGLDFQKQVAGAIGLIDQRTGAIDEKRMFDNTKFALSVENMGLEEQNQAITQRITDLQGQGRAKEAQQTQLLLDQPIESRKQAFNAVKLASLTPEQVGKYILNQQGGQKQTPVLQNFGAWDAMPENTPQEKARKEAFAYGAGFTPKRATLEEKVNTQQQVGDIKTQQDIIAAGGKEEAKLEAQAKLKPQLEQAISEAKVLGTRRGEEIADFPQTLRALESNIRQSDRVISKVNEALDQVGFYSTGFAGKALKGLPTTDAYKLRTIVETIQANLSFDKLMEIKASSKTGGGLGNVTERELDLLMSSVENLDIGLDDATLSQNLANVIKYYESFKKSQMNDVKRTGERLGIEQESRQQTAAPITQIGIDQATGEQVTFTLINGQWVRQ